MNATRRCCCICSSWGSGGGGGGGKTCRLYVAGTVVSVHHSSATARGISFKHYAVHRTTAMINNNSCSISLIVTRFMPFPHHYVKRQNNESTRDAVTRLRAASTDSLHENTRPIWSGEVNMRKARPCGNGFRIYGKHRRQVDWVLAAVLIFCKHARFMKPSNNVI